jgi:hypothetical protein
MGRLMDKKIKKILRTVLIVLVLLLVPSYVFGAPRDFLGGVYNEYEYEEYVFVTGEPIKFVGTIKVTEPDRGTRSSVVKRYNYTLEPADKTIDGRINRTFSYTTTYEDRNDKGQTLANTSISSFSETITINGDRYTLEEYIFSKSDTIDNRPASHYYIGSLTGKKVYKINNGEGRLIIELSGGNVGYENFWGKTETQIIDYELSTERELTIKGEVDEDGNKEEDYTVDVAWKGSYRVQASDSTSKTLIYSESQPHLISFDGSYMKKNDREMVSLYEYNLPLLRDKIPHSSRRNSGYLQLIKQMTPTTESLIVPKFRDVGGHWAEYNIRKVYSLDLFDDVDEYFLPEVPSTRLDFTKAVVKACNIEVSANIQEEARPTRRTRYEEPKEDTSPFIDFSSEHEDYNYVMEAVNREIITGLEHNKFGPNNPLTRAQAVTILVRALGFENKAPTPGYRTAFNDDYQIPNWAKDSVYVAREIGLVNGDNYNNFNPNQVMTRAQAATMLVRFLEFLENDLQKDYRENIILY